MWVALYIGLFYFALCFVLALLWRASLAGGFRAWGRLVSNRLAKLWHNTGGRDIGEHGDLSEGR